jgi:bla regulator protein BlaR1
MTGLVEESIVALSRSVELTMLAKVTATLLLGLMAVELARRARAAVRHLLLAATFGALVALVFVADLLPPLTIQVPAASTPAPFSSSAPPSGRISGTTTPGVSGAPVRAAASTWNIGRRMPAFIWGGGAVLLLGSIGAALLRLRGIRRRGLPWPERAALIQMLKADLDIRRSVSVLLHEDVAAPLTCGVRQATILLPLDARGWDEADLRRALVHELEHVSRGDWAIQLMARAVCAVYWFHPLVWTAWRKLCLEAERACDDAVLQVAERTEYAGQLVALARRLSAAPQPALGMANRSDLAARVSALLDVNQRRGRASVRSAVLTIVVAAIAVLTIAPLRAVRSDGRAPQATQQERGTLTATLQQAADQAALTAALQQAADRATLVSKVEQAAQPCDATQSARRLYRAAERGDIERMTELLDAGANANCGLEGDGTPLIGAAREGRLAAVRLLLDRGADPNVPLKGDGNPIIMAAREGYADVVELLLDRGADIDQIVPGDENALIQASGEGHLEVVKLLVARGANVNARAWADSAYERPGGEWRTPLSMAAQGRHHAVIDFLRASGARE